MTAHVRRLLGFALVPATSFLASLVLLPVISARFGAPAWSAVALGQSAGAIASILIGLTWPFTGGNAVASSVPGARQRIFAQAIASQAVAFVIAGVAMTAVVLLIAPDQLLATVLFGFGVALNGFSASWYYAGIGRPGALVVNEGVVRLAGYVVALVCIVAGLGLLSYAVCTVVAGLVMLAANWRSIMRGSGIRLRPAMVAEGWRIARAEWFGTLSRVVLGLWTFGGTPLYAATGVRGLAAYSGAMSVQATASNGLNAINNAFIEWIGGAPAGARTRRITASLVFAVVVVLLVIAGFGIVGPYVISYMFSGRLHFTRIELLLIGGGIGAAFLLRATQILVLVPLGRESVVYRTTLVNAVVGLVAFVVAVRIWGFIGGLWAPVVVDLAFLAYYARMLVVGGGPHSSAADGASEV
ncbi:hypothetical protein [Amnibacterium sp.]|uniref:hypothetical protein n=1 Tax=Amnibacterium sp. TaxID=1872496 RepID=UPI002635EE02|nr:hypothetical protein [Amnibacterium sp.]MCU1473900.1 hypothetical protein [Amnibacterium sp.]